MKLYTPNPITLSLLGLRRALYRLKDWALIFQFSLGLKSRLNLKLSKAVLLKHITLPNIAWSRMVLHSNTTPLFLHPY